MVCIDQAWAICLRNLRVFHREHVPLQACILALVLERRRISGLLLSRQSLHSRTGLCELRLSSQLLSGVGFLVQVTRLTDSSAYLQHPYQPVSLLCLRRPRRSNRPRPSCPWLWLLGCSQMARWYVVYSPACHAGHHCCFVHYV